MRKPKNYSIKEVYDSTVLEFIFEFYCSKEPSFMVEDLQKILKKKVFLTSEETKYPTYSSSILLKEYDGVRPRYQFKTGPQKYSEVPSFLSTILFWINENASLDNKTMLKVSLDYDFKDLNTINSISNMDVGKLILRLDENFISKRFPEYKNNPRSLSIKTLMPYNMSVNASNVVNIKNEFIFPVASYYAVDLTEQTRGKLTYNYIGGDNYSEKINEVNEVLNYYIITTYQVLNSTDFLPSDVAELNRLTEEYRRFRKCYYDPEIFFKVYENFRIFIDLHENKDIIKSQWFQIRDSISKLILESKVTNCKFNWDTELGIHQINKAKIEGTSVNGFQIINSEINGIIENCYLWNSKVNNSHTINTIMVNENTINNSYLINTRVDEFNEIKESFISNNGEILNCRIFDSVIKNAGLGNRAKLDEHSIIVNPKETLHTPSQTGINVEEKRDYKWVKTLRREDYKDTGFANKYEHKWG